MNTIVMDDLQGLGRLTEKAKKTIVRAFEIAKEFGFAQTEPIHVFLAIIQDTQSLPANLLAKQGVDLELTTKAIRDRLGTNLVGNILSANLSPVFSPELKELIHQSFLIAQKLSHVYVGSEHLLLGIMRLEDLMFVRDLVQAGITVDKLEKALLSNGYGANTLSENQDINRQERDLEERSSLEYFSQDMNQRAKEGRYLPIMGREKEIERLINILARKTKNNPIIVGEAGVGKTAIVEGFVQKLIKQDVPASFVNRTVLSLDVSAIIAGSRVRGDVEERVLSIVNDAMDDGDKILFIDEIHMIIGAGSAGGSGIDIANILKPYLTNSDLRVIGATTLDEYRKYIETDPALTRRFQPIFVDEVDVASALKLMEHLKPTFEEYHHVKISDDAVEEAVKLSKRYIADRYLPDKAIDLIDEAAAQVKIGKEIEIKPQLASLGAELIEVQEKKADALANNNVKLASGYRDREDELTEKIAELVEGTGKTNRRRAVTTQQIREIVTSWTGIPLSNESASEGVDIKGLAKKLAKMVMGQEHAVKSVSNAVKRSYLGIADETKPLASFLFLGPTGVGKSQLAKSLAKVMFGSEEMLIQIDMSEYMESHTVSKMIGSPPGYVGYQEGGQLTEKIRRRPYSVVLFDEIEKAHPDVLNIMLQILNDGHLQDSKGRRVSFKNTIIILTSNIGAQVVSQDSKLGFDVDEPSITTKDYNDMSDRVIEQLKYRLPPELINRFDETIVFRGLNKEDCQNIVSNLLEELKLRLINSGIILNSDRKLVQIVNEKGYSSEYGARNLKRKLQEMLENPLADFLISEGVTTRDRKKLTKIKVVINKNNIEFQIVNGE